MSRDDTTMEWYGNQRPDMQSADQKLEATATPYERLTWEGRKVAESKELGGGYCGSCSLAIHVGQLRDPKWRQYASTTLDHWAREAPVDYRLLIGDTSPELIEMKRVLDVSARELEEAAEQAEYWHDRHITAKAVYDKARIDLAVYTSEKVKR